MTIDTELLSAQMRVSRRNDGRFERLVDGEWVAWPVLPLDKIGRNEAKRVIQNGAGRRRHNGAET